MNKQARRREAAIIIGAPSGISVAADLVANNVDLLTEILLWLPMKSTFRFKCVSKHWLSLLSDSQFATNHFTRNPRPSSISGLYYYIEQTLRSVSLHGCGHNLPSLSFLKDSKAQSTVFVEDSCNGLLLCYYYGRACGSDYKPQFIVCNPTTKKYALLPKLDGLATACHGYLAFDPSKSPYHYKVVLFDYYRHNHYQIHVYSSQSLFWRKVFPDQNCFCFGRGVFWNGAIHWLTGDHFLKRFDVDVEEMIAMPIPQSPKIFSRYRTMYFGKCGDSLILIQSPSYCPSEFKILELEKDYSGWVVKCRVNLKPLISEFPEMESRSHKNSNSYSVLHAVEGENGRGFALLKASNKRRKAVLNVTPSEISPAAELIASNVDLLTEILLRLLARSTIRFKSVSKHWLSLLSDSQFATNHSTRNPRPSSISVVQFTEFKLEKRFLTPKIYFGSRCLLEWSDPLVTDDDFLKRFDVDVEEIIAMPNLNGWVVKHGVNLRPLISAFPEMERKRNYYCPHGFKVLCAVKGENESGFVLSLAIPGIIISYNPKEKTWDVLRDLEPHESNILIWNTAELIAANVDLLTEILLQLPAKSTIRFKCVSKHWLSLLSDSQFATNHSTQNSKPSSISGLYFYIEQKLRSVSLHRCGHNLPPLPIFLKHPRVKSTVSVEDSCNGLLLCFFYSRPRGNDDEPQCIVCNPTTKKYTLLPKHDVPVDGGNGYLAFDPSKSPHHYKVVLVDFRPDPYQINVYSSQSLCWRKVFPDQKCFGRGVFWNGAIHWLTDDHFLKRFDVDVEEIIAMPNPESPKILSRNKTMYFGECGGGLILIQSHSHRPIEFRILELEKDYSGWVVKCWVNLRPLISKFPEMDRRCCNNSNSYNVLYVVKGENGRGFALLLAIPGRIISYNPKYKTWDMVRDVAPCESNTLGLHSYALPFVETLFSV
ncbi:hypothetical protein RHSIM_Rhsim01G0013300 [Rhododendron simsii]|uniref:F-box domain-containing protein n=1 Tax=Rhododendron simsii TaxID=118357 RepID=A0A834HI59_RHOSS|nr:hypothetical protein RHSIM_Rhsim01G0013300 [Rhododendron simsii]